MKDKIQTARKLIRKIAGELLGAAVFFILGCAFIELIYYAHDISYADKIDRIANWGTFLYFGITASGLFMLIRWSNEDTKDRAFLARISDRTGWYMKAPGGVFGFIFLWPVVAFLAFLPLLYRRIVHLGILRGFINDHEYRRGSDGQTIQEDNN